MLSPLLVLTEAKNNSELSNQKSIRKEAGLYHFAILLSERSFWRLLYGIFKKTLNRITMKAWLTMVYLSRSISMILISMELRFIVTDYLQYGNGMKTLKAIWLQS